MSAADKPSLSEQLADWILDQKANGMPDVVLGAARTYLLDWLGSALAGHATDPGRKLLDYAAEQPAGPCRIVGSDMSRSAEVAALVNGGLSHIVEMDDLDRGSVVHPGAVIIPAALAVADQAQANRRDLLSALVAGYEVAIRIGEAVGKEHYFYFHNTSTCGVFGAAAAAGWLLELNREQLVWALGNAGTQAAGLWQFNADGDMSKHLHTGRAAANGVLAADLAARDFSGARRILEGRRGFFAATAPGARPERVVAGLDARPPAYKIQGASIKPHASCRHTHPAIDAALALQQSLPDYPIERVAIETYQAALDLCDNPDPQTPYAAKFSLHYCVASALCRSHAGLEAFTPQAIQAPPLRSLLPRITATVDPVFEAQYPQRWPTRVRIWLADGSEHSHTVTAPKGDPENPLTPAELEAKFRQLAAFGGHKQHVEDWLHWVNQK
ncbi:MAG TPA: MmgE/PrpD family protein [Anaerolineae bacterium]